MRLATYNVEWFSNLFDDDGRLIADNSWSGRRDVTKRQQTEALGIVFETIDADAVMVIEAPDTHKGRSGEKALETFAREYGLRTTKALIGYDNQTQQEIALLYDSNVLTARHDPGGDKGGTAPRFDTEFSIDLDIDATPDVVRWSKPPLELAIETASGQAFRMIGVHAKSKAPHGARSKEAVTQISIANRRKQLAQCIWLRARVDEHLDRGDPLIVLGDFNDGPGLDEYEKLFGRSGVEIVIGPDAGRQMFDPHAQASMSRRFGPTPTTARFVNHKEGRIIQALLDYVMVSPDLYSKSNGWRVYHPYEDLECYAKPDLRDALIQASDHFPVTLDIDL